MNGRTWWTMREALRAGLVAALLASGCLDWTCAGGPGAPGGTGSPDARSGDAPHAARARFLMGTPLAIEATGVGVEEAIEAAFAEVERLDGILSNWRADSELTRLNREAGGGPVPCSPDLLATVTAALRWAAETGGAFDPTIESDIRRLGLRGPEGRLPGVAYASDGQPAPAAAPAPGARADWRRILVDPARRSVAFAARGTGIDLGGIGKGYALDAALRVLIGRRVRSALLDFAGQVLVYGPGPDDGGWLIGVARGDDRLRAATSFRLMAGSASTSGDGERSVGSAAGIVGHILDPATGRPAPFAGSVTVVAGDATTADALSTALFVMGPDRGLAWAAAHGFQALYLIPDGPGGWHRRSTAGFGAPGQPS